MSDIIVCKSGGSSLASATAVKTTIKMIEADPRRTITVFSGPGIRYKHDTKVTDQIIACLAARKELLTYNAIFDDISARFKDIVHGLGLEMPIDELLIELRDAIDTERAAFAESRGEYIMARIMASALRRPFVDAADIIKFEHTGLNAELTYDFIHERLKGMPCAVIPGYYGSMLSDNAITLFSRGGSDITGSLVARAIGASVYENWTDVPGAMTADPRIVKDAATITRMSHAELREMAAAGATVMHYTAVKPVMQVGIPIHMRNTFDPDGPFSEVVSPMVHRRGTVIGVTGKRGLYALTISDTGSYDTNDFLLRVSMTLHGLHIPIRHMSDGFDDVTFLIDAIPDRIEEVVAALRDKLQDADVVYRPAARVALIGEGMWGVPGFLGRAATTLGQHGINIISPSQSATERSIIFAIEESALDQAIRVLHAEYVERLA